MGTTLDFTATTVIVFGNRVLLHKHRKLGIWIPVGGHIDKDELPEDAVIREAKEEAGLDIKLFGPDASLGVSDVRELVRPMHILLEDIEPGHQHIDMIFYATSETDSLSPRDGEASDLKWFTREELESEEIPENVRAISLDAIRTLGKD